jgi:hypothetical protein
VRAPGRRRIVVESRFVRVDDAENRSARVEPGGQVVMVVAGIEPDLVGTADLRDRRDDVAAYFTIMASGFPFSTT